MSLPRYPSYQDSGVSWLAELPTHWTVCRYKQVFDEREERSEGGKETLLSVSAYTGVSPRSEIVDVGDHLSRAESLEGYKVCYPNDLVMNIMLAWNRGLGFSAHHGIVSPAYAVFQPRPGNAPRFLDYMVRSDRVTLYYKAFSSGVIDSRLRLYPDTFGALYCVLPPLSEQLSIVNFLDRETAKIDALIAEQVKLIALLAEKRQATISHAVTRGLNPEAPMKVSGAVWLGEVPAHWQVKALKHLAKLVTGMTPPTEQQDNYSSQGMPWIRPEDLDEKGGASGATKFLSTQGQVFSRPVKAGSTLICCIGTIGKAGIVHQTVSTNQQITAAMFRGDGRFFYFATCAARKQLETSATGNVLKILNTERLGEIRFPEPPFAEQTSIAGFLDIETAKIDLLTAEAERGIGLLAERRSALISAAVTGQIDVRGAVPQPDQQEELAT